MRYGNVKRILDEIQSIEIFILKNHKEYLTDKEYNKYQTILNELRIKVKLKKIENNIMDALTLISNKDYLKARNNLKNSSKDIDKLEDEMINLKIKTFNNHITNLKNQVNNELNSIKNLLLGEDSSINVNSSYNSSANSNSVNPSFSRENESSNKLNELLSKYQNPIKIGEGGFSHVFKVIKNNKTIALKVPKELTETTGELFLREIGNWKKLEHINIVRLYYSNIYPYPYIEMEYCEKELNKIKNNLELKEAVLLIFEILNGLKYAHSKNIIHKDLKPHNILINNNIPKITDWGLSKETTSKSTTLNALTLQYSAPEQISRGTIDKITDIYQMGVILYELTTKKLPFNGSEFDIIDSIKNEIPPKPSKLNPLIDEELEAIILKCIQKDKSKRYQSVEQLQKDLSEYLNIQLTTKLTASKTNKDFSRSVFYCSDIVLYHILNDDLENALNYLYDLKQYANKYCSNEIIEAVDNLINAIEYRIKEGIKEPSEDIKIKAKIIIDKVKKRL